MTRPGTLGELRASGWESRPVKDEVRANALARIAAGKPLVDGVIGFDDTVLPQLENALLAGHDVIFLGERGQAKTRIIRSLVELLDEWTPTIAGSEVNDDPYAPISQHARLLHAERGDETPIEWVHRERRFGEKLATPDTSIADLIGEVDPIKVAEGRYLADELTIHYGVVPRVSDLDALVSSTAGKIEFETLDDGREEQVLERLVKASVLEVFRARTRPERLARLVAAFDEGVTVHTGEDVAASDYAGLLPKLDGLRDALADLGVGETPAGVASAVEFVLEGLHLSKRLNKDAVGGKATYRGRG